MTSGKNTKKKTGFFIQLGLIIWIAFIIYVYVNRFIIPRFLEYLNK